MLLGQKTPDHSVYKELCLVDEDDLAAGYTKSLKGPHLAEMRKVSSDSTIVNIENLQEQMGCSDSEMFEKPFEAQDDDAKTPESQDDADDGRNSTYSSDQPDQTWRLTEDNMSDQK
eukprot:UN03449